MHTPMRIGGAGRNTLRLIITAALLALAGHAPNARAQTETNLYTFGSFPNDATQPFAALVQGNDGNFYGTTYHGGTNNNGTVFRISPGGVETILHTFTGASAAFANGLVQGSDSNLYGTTFSGGTNNNGTIFRISPGGSFTNLYLFVGSPGDGQGPFAGLILGNDGSFYGTTYYGGSNEVGTVFRITSSGSYTTLYAFAGFPNDGAHPEAALVQGSDGNFYGTTIAGGTNGVGNIFRITPGGSETNLYSFVGSPTDGAEPTAALVQGSDGNFYGTTHDGGTNNLGTVFRISPAGSYTNLYSFVGFPSDGSFPGAGLVQGSDGNFYGTTITGGTNHDGTVFRISPSGVYISLYSLGNSPTDGHQPQNGLVQGSDGSFYGTAMIGGTNNLGTVFKLTVPFNPPANQVSAIQVAGTNVVLSIPSVASEIYQLQFTSAMSPTNWINQGGSITSGGSLLTVTNLGGALLPQGFYRFDITP